VINGNKSLKLIIFWLIFISVNLLIASSLFAQDRSARGLIQNLQRVDLRELGYPQVNEIPENSSAITSLLSSRNGKIYGGTSGEEAYLFVFNPLTNKVHHLGRIPAQEGIHHSMVEDDAGQIYFGTGRDMFKRIKLSKGGKWEPIDEVLWSDIKHHFDAYPGGHLYKYNPELSDQEVKLPDMGAEIEDLGIPVPHNSIYALTVSPDGTRIYGLTYPDGHFFIYLIEDKVFRDLGAIDPKIVFHGPERDWRSLPRALICDRQGRVYTSSTDGVLVYYSPVKDTIQSTGQKIPGDYYYEQSYEDYAVVEYFAQDTSGVIYGGTSDGFLFAFHPNAMELDNLGKPRSARRLRCLTVGLDGKIYFLIGERPETARAPCHFFSYDPVRGSFEEYGLLIADRSPYYYRRGFQFDSMVTGEDGTIYIGESERQSHLYLFMPIMK